MAEVKIVETQVQVRFSTETEFGRYQDALYYPPEVYAAKDVSEIEAEAQARVDAWEEVMKNPPPPPPEPKGE
jgi:hypothetical protein